jgi:hypothetical protein
MDTRKVATEYRLAQWAQRLQERSERRQSIQEFCEAEGIARNKYFYWQRKVREATCVGIARISTVSRSPQGWTRLTEVESLAERQGVSIEVGGCRIIATSETDMELLARICSTLQGIC